MIKNNKGFTLIELLVVIAVIGLLATVTFVSLGPVRSRGRDTQRIADLKQANLAMEMCYDDLGCGGGSEKYPDTAAGDVATDNVKTIGTYFTIPDGPTGDKYKWTDGTNAIYCLYGQMEGETDTYFCVSNEGSRKESQANYTVTNADCCGMSLTD